MVAIVAARLLVPLLIPRFPLPMIVLALVLDAADNSLLAAFTDVDLSDDGSYQSFDKALDIYYLAIAYLSTLRNWTNEGAVRIARFLFYYRLVGVALFELLDSRAMLLVFPNTFEYFFIAYEAIRLRFDPSRVATRVWLLVAAGLWVLVKLPQEYWIHVAQRDFTDTVRDAPVVGVLCALVVLALVAVALLVVRPRLPAPDWGWRVAADPPPPLQPRTRLVWTELAEKIGLLALICVIFAEILPDVEAGPLQVVVGVAGVVAANALIGSRLGFAVLLLVNLGLVFLGHRLLAEDDFQLGAGLFFAGLVTLVVWLYDRYKPVHDAVVSSHRNDVRRPRAVA